MDPSPLIQVQIAAGLSEDGVDDVRWVLLDPGDAPQATPAAAAAKATAASAGPDTVPAALDPRPTRRCLRDPTLRVLVLLAAMAGAWWATTIVTQAAARVGQAPVPVEGRST